MFRGKFVVLEQHGDQYYYKDAVSLRKRGYADTLEFIDAEIARAQGRSEELAAARTKLVAAEEQRTSTKVKPRKVALGTSGLPPEERGKRGAY